MMKQTLVLLFGVLSAWILAGESKASALQPFTAKDQVEVRRVADGDISPDGQWLVYTLSRLHWKEARRFTDLFIASTKDGSSRQLTFTEQASESSPAWSKGSRSIVFLSDRGKKRQLYVIDVLGGEARQIGNLNEEVTSFAWSPDGSRIAFLTGEGLDQQVWIWKAESGETVRLTSHPTPVTAFWWAPDSKAVYFRAPDSYDEVGKRERYKKGFDVIVVDEPVIPEHLWLLDLESKSEQRLTSGNEFSVSRFVIASGGRVGAFTAWTTDRYYQRITETLLYLVDLSAGGAKRVTELTDYPFRVAWDFSPDVNIARDEDSGKLLASVTDHEHPSDYYLVPSLGDVADRSKWRRLTNGNPQLEAMALGRSEVVTWTSADGREVEGILVTPAGYEKGKRYPLIVQLHGGPYFATSLEFPGGTRGIHVLASRGYALLRPNYRGSTHYGERFKTEIAGRFFHLGFQDIVSGVDEMIRRGITDPDKLGMMGWSAGGHFSNWTLTHTDRFKAISSGAGAVNWISMYAQTDSQATREFVLGKDKWLNWGELISSVEAGPQ
jgi:dipeptidyl aminopeptidase/acylaminoacyl peptidase